MHQHSRFNIMSPFRPNFIRTSLALIIISLLSCTATAANSSWPPILDMDPAVQPPKWEWQLTTPITIHPDTDIRIYEIDMFDNETKGEVAKLHSLGKKVICYINVGSWEDWRDDKDNFPAGLLGKVYDGYPDEKWLDIRDVNPDKSRTGNRLAHIMAARFDRAAAMGCDAIEPDNINGYTNPTGFPLSYDDQMYYNLWIANEVRSRGMLVALKNDLEQAKEERIINAFDFVISEQCLQYQECEAYSGFLALNKPVFVAEYSGKPSKFCEQAKAFRLSAIRKNESLDDRREGCDAFYGQR